MMTVNDQSRNLIKYHSLAKKDPEETVLKLAAP